MNEGVKYGHILSYVRDTPWAILPERLAVILDLLAYRAQGGSLTDEEIHMRIGAARAPGSSQLPSIAVLPLFGVIAQRMNLLMASSGGTSTDIFSRQFRQAMADPQISAVIIDVDSPGGTVQGVDELASEIFQARGSKPIVAVANSLAASAAYWIASAASEIVVTPTGEVGSIGVLAAHQDISAAQEKEGVRTTLISAGKYKTEANPLEPLTIEARTYIQGRVDDYYGMMTRAIAKNRAVSTEAVRNGFGEGRLVGAKQAVSLGMADQIGTLDETITRLIRQARLLANAGLTRQARERRLRLHATI